MRKNSDCIILRPDGRYQCSVLGIVYSPKAKPPISCVCGTEIPPEVIAEFDADLLELGVVPETAGHRKSLWSKWREAIARWKTAGKPVRGQAEIQRCLTICKSCDQYDIRLGMNYCKACGCHVNGLLIGELNKIRMATESCPLKRWR